MNTKTFGVEIVRAILNTDECDIGHPSFRLQLVEPTGRTFEDSLVEEWCGVFEWEDGKFYQAIYRKPAKYYRESGGDAFGPLEHIVGGSIECQEVFPHRIVRTVYKATPQK